MKMSDLAKLLGDAYQNLDSFPLDKQKEILDLASKEIARIYRDPHLIGLVDHSFATQAQLTPEQDRKIHDHVFKILKEKTGLKYVVAKLKESLTKLSNLK